MKIVLLGTVEFSQRMLDKLLDMGTPIAGIITSTAGHSYSDFADLTRRASQEEIPLIRVDDANDSTTLSWLSSLEPDYVFCFGWSQLLRAKFLSIPRRGTIGYHPAALPENRGRHPIIWAIVLGLKETASTFFMINEGVDSGPIISQEKVPISQREDAASLYGKLVTVAERQLEQFMPLLEKNLLNLVEQDILRSSSWRKRSERDGEIDWRMAASTIDRTVRGLAKPYVGAHFLYQGNLIKLWRCSVEGEAPRNAEPGKILDIKNDKIFVKAGVGAVWLEHIEPEIFPERGTYL